MPGTGLVAAVQSDGQAQGSSWRLDGQNSATSYYRARYYDPQPGRFLSEDPMRFTAGVNFYRYVKNNATDLTDPYGLKVQKCCRNPQINWWADFLMKLSGQKHCFIRTDTVIAGMGAAGQDDLPACPI